MELRRISAVAIAALALAAPATAAELAVPQSGIGVGDDSAFVVAPRPVETEDVDGSAWPGAALGVVAAFGVLAASGLTARRYRRTVVS